MQLTNFARDHPAPRSGDTHAKALASIAEAINSLRYGAIQVTIHDGRVVQLDVTERQRFT